jgi:hypothetical protein
MRNNWRAAFRRSVGREVAQLGYTVESDTIFAKKIYPGVLGCIGYLTTTNAVRPFVGVYFEQVEQVFDEIFEPLRVMPSGVPHYFPTISRDISEIKEDQSIDASGRVIENEYFLVELAKIPVVSRQLLVDVQEFGLRYIEASSTLSGAAVTMASGRGGGVGWVAHRLPIIYWILGRASEAKSCMAYFVAQKYPIGDYQRYADLLTSRIDSGPVAG